MTFACDDNLYLTSVAGKSLYRVDLDGNATSLGNLGVDIVAIAAYGDPVKLYGLGLGTTTPSLYEIDTGNGLASKIGTTLDADVTVADYSQGGLAFDDSGQLWAITDSAQQLPQGPSQRMRIDEITGKASDVHNTLEKGFESLAITVPRGCATEPSGDFAEFVVQKRFIDRNDQTAVTLNIQCDTGNPISSSVTVVPNDLSFGAYEAKFVVDNIPGDTVSCEIWESDLDYYSASYDCFSEGSCSTAADRCIFEDSTLDQANLCTIRNDPDPVTINVTSEWFYGSLEEGNGESVRVNLICEGALDGNGKWKRNVMKWSWVFEQDSEDQVAMVVPDFGEATQCRTETHVSSSAVESSSTCSDWETVKLGDDPLTCSVTNTVFFEGIPTLNQYGLLLISALMLLTGMAATRRF